jgi:hypothetical protein
MDDVTVVTEKYLALLGAPRHKLRLRRVGRNDLQRNQEREERPA